MVGNALAVPGCWVPGSVDGLGDPGRLVLAGGCDDVHGALGMADQFAGQGGVVDAGDVTVAWGAYYDQVGVACVGEVGEAPAGAAVPADHSQQVAAAGHPGGVDPLEVVGDEV